MNKEDLEKKIEDAIKIIGKLEPNDTVSYDNYKAILDKYIKEYRETYSAGDRS